ncbi:MAG TPA: hypothetical protein VGL81_00990 [Polyangiaceae bacterium]|jgi:hypothetical protein
MRIALLAVLATLLGTSAGCYSAGPYGHSPRYVELSDETTAVTGAREYDPVMVERQPEEWRKGRVTLFGVVESRTAGPGGQALLKLSVRRLDPRNLCVNEHDDDSCRVTVSDKDFGVVYALVTLRGDDDVGPRAVGQRSLMRIVGSLGQDVSPADGAPIVHTSFARHWPVYFYVTHASAGAMRQ